MMSGKTRSTKKKAESKDAEKSRKKPTKIFSPGKDGELTDYVISKVGKRFEPVFLNFHGDVVDPGVTPVFHVINVTKYQYQNTFGVLFKFDQDSYRVHRKVRVTNGGDKAAALNKAVNETCFGRAECSFNRDRLAGRWEPLEATVPTLADASTAPNSRFWSIPPHPRSARLL